VEQDCVDAGFRVAARILADSFQGNLSIQALRGVVELLLL
jgi:hypothetical protein